MGDRVPADLRLFEVHVCTSIDFTCHLEFEKIILAQKKYVSPVKEIYICYMSKLGVEGVGNYLLDLSVHKEIQSLCMCPLIKIFKWKYFKIIMHGSIQIPLRYARYHSNTS